MQLIQRREWRLTDCVVNGAAFDIQTEDKVPNRSADADPKPTGDTDWCFRFILFWTNNYSSCSRTNKRVQHEIYDSRRGG